MITSRKNYLWHIKNCQPVQMHSFMIKRADLAKKITRQCTVFKVKNDIRL